jgi:hypothetical protein
MKLTMETSLSLGMTTRLKLRVYPILSPATIINSKRLSLSMLPGHHLLLPHQPTTSASASTNTPVTRARPRLSVHELRMSMRLRATMSTSLETVFMEQWLR